MELRKPPAVEEASRHSAVTQGAVHAPAPRSTQPSAPKYLPAAVVHKPHIKHLYLALQKQQRQRRECFQSLLIAVSV